MNSILIIPAFEPSENLITLVDDLLGEDFPEIILIDDGSSPEKKNIFQELQRRTRVTLLTHAVNLGKGAALKTAFNYVLVSRPDCKGCVTVDADGQHLPKDVVKVANAMSAHPSSLILGARQFDAVVPFRSKIGNTLTRHIFNFLLGKKIVDTQTGLRGIPTTLMYELLKLTTGRYEFELDMLITTHQSGLEILEVPITTVYEEGNKSSHFNPFLDSLRIYFVFARFLFSSFATYLTDVLFFTISYMTTKNMPLSFFIGRTMGLGVSLLGSKLFVFRSKRNLWEVVPKFILLWFILLCLSYGLMLWLVQVNFNVYVARGLVDSALFVFNFLVQRDLIFKNKEQG